MWGKNVFLRYMGDYIGIQTFNRVPCPIRHCAIKGAVLNKDELLFGFFFVDYFKYNGQLFDLIALVFEFFLILKR